MELWHMGILTPDIDQTLDTICAVPGADRSAWTLGEIAFSPDEMVTGEGGRLKTAFGRMGGVAVELLEPLDERSYHAAALKKRGPGFHHAAYVCGNELDAVIDAALAAGARIVWEARHGDEHVCYMESADGGSVFEYINVCPFMPE